MPAMSKVQDDKSALRDMTRRSIKISTYIIMPCMTGIAACADSFVSIILTDKWLPCVFFLRVFCFSYAFWPIHTSNLNAIRAMGRSDLFLKLEMVKKTIGIIAILTTMWISVEAMALSLIVTSILGQLINSYPNAKLLKYNYWQQLMDMLPQMGLSIFMGIVVYCVQLFMYNSWITLLIQIPLGVFIYLCGSRLLRIDSYNYLVNAVKMISKTKKE